MYVSRGSFVVRVDVLLVGGMRIPQILTEKIPNYYRQISLHAEAILSAYVRYTDSYVDKF